MDDDGKTIISRNKEEISADSIQSPHDTDCHYRNKDGNQIKGYSMNVSPMGEAYGNFGVQGGIIFMFFYGLFFSDAIFLLLKVIRKRPTLILWFPVLFLNSIQIETDILMCVNSLLKNLIFIGFCYWAADRFLRLKF